MVTNRTSSRFATAPSVSSTTSETPIVDTADSAAASAAARSADGDAARLSARQAALRLRGAMSERNAARAAAQITRAESTQARRAQTPSPSFESLPIELHQKIAENPTLNARDVVQLAQVNRQFRETLTDQVQEKQLIHLAKFGEPGVPRWPADLGKILKHPLMNSVVLGSPAMRARIIAAVVQQIGVVCRTPGGAGAVLSEVGEALERLQIAYVGEDKLAIDQTLEVVATQFNDANFSAFTAPFNGIKKQADPLTHAFFHRFQLLVQARPAEQFTALRNLTANGLYMIDDDLERIGEWKRLFAACDPEFVETHDLITALAKGLVWLPLGQDREHGRIDLLAMLPKLPEKAAGHVIATLIGEAATNTIHPQRLPMINALWNRGVALTEPASRTLVASAMLAWLGSMPVPDRYRWFSRGFAVFDQADRVHVLQHLPRAAQVIRHLPEFQQRLQAMNCVSSFIVGIDESIRTPALKGLIDTLAFIEHGSTRLDRFSYFCRQALQLSSPNLDQVIPHLGDIAQHWPHNAERHAARSDLLLLIGQTNGLSLKAHLNELIAGAISSAPKRELLHVLHWSHVAARRLPDSERSSVLALALARGFSSRRTDVLRVLMANIGDAVTGLPTTEIAKLSDEVVRGLNSFNDEVYAGISNGVTGQVQVENFKRLCRALAETPPGIKDSLARNVVKTLTFANAQIMPYTPTLVRVLHDAGLLERYLAVAPQVVAIALRAQLALTA